MNAINNDGQYTGDNYNNASMIINEWPQAVGISEVHAANFNFSFGPNPANGAISINYILQQQTNVTIDIYDTNGKLLMPLHTANEPAGVHSLTADVSALSRGVYIITINTEMGHTSKRLVVAE